MVRRVAVAASGGRDSTALLHATCRAARDLGVDVVALHVHHGLMARADDWLTHLKRQCARWSRAGLLVTFDFERLTTAPRPGDSVEAWARRERYLALGRMARAHGVDLVLLAHHRRDQAETVLLQALRGAGPAGLAAMPRSAQRDGIVWSRPWLDMPREAIDAYVQRHRLSHIDDESNHDSRLARSRLRRQAWQALEASFPAAETALAHAAFRAQEAAQCLRELAVIDLDDCGTPDGLGMVRARWQALSSARRANAMRAWLGRHMPGGVPDTLVARLCEELPRATTGHAWPAGSGRLRLHRGVLSLVDDATPLPGGRCAMDLSAIGVHEVPGWGGALIVDAVATGGVPAELLAHAEIRPRTGGEQFQRSVTGESRSLKKAFQAAGLGVEDRHGPLVHAGEGLVYVPGLGLDARAVSAPGVPRRQLRWQPRG